MAVDLAGITRRFGPLAAVDGVDLRIAAGEFFAVLGPSGCGKSTLLRLIAGLETADAGTIAIAGRAMAGPGLHVPPEARGVGVVFQSYALWPHMTVRENVAFPVPRGPDRAARVDRCLAMVELGAFADRRPADLSGGQRQRVALARCLAQEAGTILMDEPLANLDPHLRAAMEEELAAFHRRSGATTLYITHDQAEAMALADRVAIRRSRTGRPRPCRRRRTW
jgi:iron(III) transport system ATP-binding protein